MGCASPPDAAALPSCGVCVRNVVHCVLLVRVTTYTLYATCAYSDASVLLRKTKKPKVMVF